MMWGRGLRSGGRLWPLALALLLLGLPLSSWAAPSVEEALKALSQAEAALSKAETALIEAEKDLAASKEDSVKLGETLDRLRQELTTLRGEYEMRLKESEALKMQSAELSYSLKASQGETLTAERWAFGLGVGALLALLGWIFL